MISFIRWRATSPPPAGTFFIILSFDGKFYRITIIAMARTQAGIATRAMGDYDSNKKCRHRLACCQRHLTLTNYTPHFFSLATTNENMALPSDTYQPNAPAPPVICNFDIVSTVSIARQRHRNKKTRDGLRPALSTTHPAIFIILNYDV